MRLDRYYSEPPYEISVKLRHKKDDEIKRFTNEIDRSYFTKAHAIRKCLLFGIRAIGCRYTDVYGVRQGYHDELNKKTIEQLLEDFEI